MDISKHGHLIGWYNSHSYEIENTPESVADFIIHTGNEGVNAVISTPDHETVITTCGIYVDRCQDQAFLQKLLPVLIPKQHEVENELGLHCGCEESGEDQGMGGLT